MAGKATSVYLTVTTKQHQVVYNRMFFNAKDYNDYISTDKFQEEYPLDHHILIKEIY